MEEEEGIEGAKERESRKLSCEMIIKFIDLKFNFKSPILPGNAGHRFRGHEEGQWFLSRCIHVPRSNKPPPVSSRIWAGAKEHIKLLAFDFLGDENSRKNSGSAWDILSNGGLVQEMAHIANGCDPGSFLSS